MSFKRKILGGRYKLVGGRLGDGNFGEVRLGLDTFKNNRQVWISKFENENHNVHSNE